MKELYPSTPSITLHDPLAELLGAGNGQFTYTFLDAVKLSGHACPTVAGAFLMAVHGVKALFGDEMPVRGQIRVTVPGPVSAGVNGPISQVLTLITGAAADNGFHGLNGHHVRSGLMDFAKEGSGAFRFQRMDNEQLISIGYNPSAIPSDPEMNVLMKQVMQGQADAEGKKRFGELWRARVVSILEDNGEHTLSIS